MTIAYRLDADAAAIGAALAADPGRDPWSGGGVAPGDVAPVVVADARHPGRRRLRPMLWGFPPPPQGTNIVPTLRNPDSPFWIGTLRHIELRCLIPATAILVRKQDSGASPAQSHGRSSAPVMALAGIFRSGEELPHFALVTTTETGHARSGRAIPLALDADGQQSWLGAPWTTAKSLLDPAAAGFTQF